MKKIFTFLLLVCAISAQAVTYYVNPSHPNASDSNWGDDPEHPWATLNISSWIDDCTIMVSNGTYDMTVMGVTRAILGKNIEVIGESKTGVIIQGESDMDFNFGYNTHRFFKILTGANVTFQNATIKNLIFDGTLNMEENTTHTYGGAFEVEANATLNLKHVDVKNVKVYGGTVNSWGAGIMNNGTVNVDSCSFTNCYSTQGGAMYLASGSTSNITNTTFKGNGNPSGTEYDTYRFGGAFVLSLDPTVNIDKCYFESNFSLGTNAAGGVFMLRWGTDKVMNLSVTNSVFYDNKTAGAGAVLSTQAESSSSAATEMNINFTNCVFLKNQGCLQTTAYNNTISLPLNNSYQGTGNFVFINNTLFKNYNSGSTGQTTNARSIALGDNYMKYYLINNLMNDNEDELGNPVTGIYGLVLEGGYDVAPTRLTTMVAKGNVLNATGGAFSSVNFPDLSIEMCPECKNQTGQRLMRSQLQTDLVVPSEGLPYIPFTSSQDSVSVALNNGVNEYLLNGINIVPSADINGTGIDSDIKDAGAWEMIADGSSIHANSNLSNVIYPTIFSDFLYINTAVESVAIYNVSGRCIYQQKNPNSIISTTSLQPGLYIVKITTEGKDIIQKIIKK